MNIVQRVQDILLKPKETWPVIDAEPADPNGLYRNYLMILALIPAVATFVGLSLIGVGGFGVNIRMPILSGLVQMVVTYVLVLTMVFVMALVVDALAPTFGGTRSRIAALKLMVYASTAGLVGGIVGLIPSLAILGLIASLYSIYLIYLGLPVLMKCPPDKSLPYTAVVAICGIVAGVLLSTLLAALAPPRVLGGRMVSDAGNITLTTPNGEVAIDTRKLDEAAKRMEEASKRMEQAQASGDTAAAGKAASEVLSALTGGSGTVVPADQLRATLPDTLGGLARESIEAQSGAAMGLGGSSANALYRDGDRRIGITVTDAALATAAWSQVTLDRETTDSVEKVYRDGKRSVREDYRKDKSHGEYTLLLENGLVVEAKGDNIDMDAVRGAVKSLDLGRIEGLKRPAKS